MRPNLSVVAPALPEDGTSDGDLPLTVPVPRAGRTPWRRDGDVTWVPAALLLAAAGRCSCDDCCSELARRRARRQLLCV